MTTEWTQGSARQVQVGDRVRTPTGTELTVSRIESPFMGAEQMLAFIEDSPERWFKQPLTLDTPVEIQAASR
jgi:hypothetical protein